jgi:hypothetical protein
MNIHLSISATPSVELRYGVGWNWADFLGSGGVYARSSTYPLSTPCVPDLHDEAGPVRHVHGSWLIGPDGKPVVILINDHLTETHRVELALPAGCEVAAWSWLSKDAVRISEQPCTLADDGSGRLVAELAPMSLNAWTPEVRLTPLKGT